MLTIFLWISTALLGYMFVVWSKSDFLNVTIKAIFFASWVLGVLVLLQHYKLIAG